MLTAFLLPLAGVLEKVLDLVILDLKDTPPHLRRAQLVARYYTFRPILLLFLGEEGKQALRTAEHEGSQESTRVEAAIARDQAPEETS